jgi:MoxR-like ATPase
LPEPRPVFRGDNSPHDGIDELPAPPPWRDFGSGRRGADPYVIGPETRDRVNAALLLRRPLLAKGRPGTGKSALAYAVAHELGLGRVLHWPVSSRTSIQEGLYVYDGLGRLQDGGPPRGGPRTAGRRRARGAGGPGDYVTLGPLGTALHTPAPDRPRVLLIDEFDKGDADLAYYLLNVLEEGSFRIPELACGASGASVAWVATADPGERALVRDAVVRCGSFPFIVLTSNGYREFPPALLRRCIQVDLPEPTRKQLGELVRLHLGDDPDPRREELLDEFLRRRSVELLATDQLLNAVYLASSGAFATGWSPPELADIVFQNLGESE